MFFRGGQSVEIPCQSCAIALIRFTSPQQLQHTTRHNTRHCIGNKIAISPKVLDFTENVGHRHQHVHMTGSSINFRQKVPSNSLTFARCECDGRAKIWNRNNENDKSMPIVQVSVCCSWAKVLYGITRWTTRRRRWVSLCVGLHNIIVCLPSQHTHTHHNKKVT